jgi:hypothetical protein
MKYGIVEEIQAVYINDRCQFSYALRVEMCQLRVQMRRKPSNTMNTVDVLAAVTV